MDIEEEKEFDLNDEVALDDDALPEADLLEEDMEEVAEFDDPYDDDEDEEEDEEEDY